MSFLIPFPCGYCQAACKPKGKRGVVQLLRCGTCGKYQRTCYQKKAFVPGTDTRIVLLTKEGCGIRSTARVLKISPTTVIAHIKRSASVLGPGHIPRGRVYEVDELSTYVGHKKKRVWVAYALDTLAKRVVSIRVGPRSKRTLRPLVETLLLSDAKRIHTDGFPAYKSLVPPDRHRVKKFGTNRIERMNVNLRTHLKRLSRRSICYSKCLSMLRACLAIYCWGK